VPGRDYFFVTEAEFGEMVARGAFLEHARVFDHWYGTGRDHVDGLLAGGHSVVLEIDWQGAQQVRESAPESHSIFILPPSVAELERRLRGRKTDAEAVIQRRLRDALGDMAHWPEFDYVVINQDFDAALEQLGEIVAGYGESARTELSAVRAAAAAIVAGH
jgi:guanylate kinase